MGCLNSEGQFDHWFGNIHLSGPCNRSCYFCIGQHMQSLEKLNNLTAWPLKGINEFILQCQSKRVREVNLTGTNTDPLLFRHIIPLREYLKKHIPDLIFGIRTNGALAMARTKEIDCFDKISFSIHSFDGDIYRAMMGSGNPPPIEDIMERWGSYKPIKINIVLGPQNKGSDLLLTLQRLARAGVEKVNLREPYGQPHIGDPLQQNLKMKPVGEVLGMPLHEIYGMHVVYWDVHYVEVESVNLYANGNVSTTYPVTKGYDPVEGKVLGQENWKDSGRQFEQWR